MLLVTVLTTLPLMTSAQADTSTPRQRIVPGVVIEMAPRPLVPTGRTYSPYGPEIESYLLEPDYGVTYLPEPMSFSSPVTGYAPFPAPSLPPTSTPAPAPGPAPAPAAPASSATSLAISMAHANIFQGLGAAGFAADLRTVTSSSPDFVTLNEAVRPSSLISVPGYSFHRGTDSNWTLETPVMWRSDRWEKLTAGTRYLHRRSGKWGIRAVNWVKLRHRDTGRVVSVVSVHPSPSTKLTVGLRPIFMSGLSSLVRELSAAGPVFVGGDLNVPYRSSDFPRGSLDTAGLRTTFDVFGMPPGGTGDHGGATIDYLLFQPAAGVTALSGSTRELQSDHDAVLGTFRYSW